MVGTLKPVHNVKKLNRNLFLNRHLLQSIPNPCPNYLTRVLTMLIPNIEVIFWVIFWGVRNLIFAREIDFTRLGTRVVIKRRLRV